MKDSITWVGLDDSAKRINVAVFYGDERDPKNEFLVVNDDSGLGRLGQKLKALPGQVRCVYEAGVSGYHLHRALTKHGIFCEVAAPSLTPRRAGKRVKTDRRDAKDLARLYRSGELTSIVIPNERQEDLRDLLRAREDALEDLNRARHRLVRFLFRRGLKYRTGKPWTRGHMQWIRALHFEAATVQSVFDEYRLALEEEMERMTRFEKEVVEAAKAPEYQKLVTYLMGLRGVKVLTAMTIIAEAIDLKRFHSARAFMSAIGLVVSEYSSGGTEHRGGITKTGNTHMRRVAIESAWHYRHPLRVGRDLQKRREGLPAEVLSTVRKADKRLHKRYWHLVNNGKDTRKAAVAVGRELAGFIWALGQVA
jgi:transposase